MIPNAANEEQGEKQNSREKVVRDYYLQRNTFSPLLLSET